MLVKHPGKDVTAGYVDNELKAIKEKVGGNIETVTLENECILICDEEGWIKRQKFNFSLGGNQFFGTVLIVGADGEEFTDCHITVKEARQLMPMLFVDEGIC